MFALSWRAPCTSMSKITSRPASSNSSVAFRGVPDPRGDVALGPAVDGDLAAGDVDGRHAEPVHDVEPEVARIIDGDQLIAIAASVLDDG